MPDGFIILRTSRLKLRYFRPSDLINYRRMFSDQRIISSLDSGPAPSEGQSWDRMALALGQWALRGYGMLAVEDAVEFVGAAGIFHPMELPGAAAKLCCRADALGARLCD